MTQSLLIEGLSDAVGFLAGSLAGLALGHFLGLETLSGGYSTSAIVGIALVGIGGGLGLQAARRWRLRGQNPKEPKS
jgi:hypothetical protein